MTSYRGISISLGKIFVLNSLLAKLGHQGSFFVIPILILATGDAEVKLSSAEFSGTLFTKEGWG